MKSRPIVIIAADAPDALVCICGVTMVDRMLRALQRAGFDQAIVFSKTPEAIQAELAKPSWARAKIRAEVRSIAGKSCAFGDLAGVTESMEEASILFLNAGNYFDPRLIQDVLASEESVALIDSNPEHLTRLQLNSLDEVMEWRSCGAFLFQPKLLRSLPGEAGVCDSVQDLIAAGKLSTLDVATLPSFVVSMRRHIRPLWFPAPNESKRAIAEMMVLDTAQKGVMEMSSYLETPLENWTLRWLWNTRITPLQITFFGLIIGVAATVAFVTGHLWIGALLALSIGVIDGLDGKQARVKVETTELGRWEGEMDYPIQMSWWIGLAWYFGETIPASHAYRWVILFLAADIVDKIFTRCIKETTGRYVENYSKLDRIIRFLGGSRSFYVWLLIFGLMMGRPYEGFIAICGWHIAVACLHGVRAGWICLGNRRPTTGSARESESF